MASKGINWFNSDGNNITLEYTTNLTGSPLEYTFVAELKALGRNPEASPEIDFTHYDSTEQEVRLGLARRGSYDATCNFAPKAASQAAIIALDLSKEERYWRVRYPKADVASSNRATEFFRASVQSAAIAPPSATDTNPADFNFTLRVAGNYQFTPES